MKKKLENIETKLVGQEHRTFPIIKNLIEYGFDKTHKRKKKAAWFAFVFNLLLSKSTIALGLAGIVGWYIGFKNNNLVQQQNHLISEQTKLIDSERKSSLIFLMSNIMDKIDEELKSDYSDNGIRDLSPQLIGRIQSLSHRLKPYYFLENGKLISKPLSPERGQLLTNLIGAELNNVTIEKIISGGNFKHSDLRGIEIINGNFNEIDLSYSDLSNSLIYQSDFQNARFEEATMKRTFIEYSDFRHTSFIKTNIEGSKFEKSNFWDSKFLKSNMSGILFIQSNFNEVELFESDFAPWDRSRVILNGIEYNSIQNDTNFNRFSFVNKSIYEDYFSVNYSLDSTKFYYVGKEEYKFQYFLKRKN